ncbi:hypothetical protein [Aestuariivivens sediminis]|uniref:hypothetical protein n=1 Tax=Aestuariivivens sediminis TaxID=2913557 RepID=UPI001F597984|nr:hypothetical protein [Aestuariivivens sediminis]
MKNFLLLVTLISFCACSTRKQVEKAVSYGNYDQAIATSIKKLSTSKNAKRKQDYIAVLEDAYNKANERDLNSINHLKMDANPESYQDIYELYVNMDSRQEAIKPLLPLAINGRPISMKFNNYSEDLIEFKEKTSDYLYEKGLQLLELEDKNSMRDAYNTLQYVESINPNFENTRELLNEAHQRGMAYVIVTINNDTQQIIPGLLEKELLNFDAYGIDNFWVAYHGQQVAGVQYDYAMQLNLKRINISPEKIMEREFIREKEIVDGWTYKLDNQGNVLKDSLGNDIKIDKMITVKCRLKEIKQFKSTQIIADVVHTDLKTNQILDSFTIDSGFVFEHLYGRIRGDRRALDKDDRLLLEHKRLPFPNNEQMVYDTGEDLKAKLKTHILTLNRRFFN